jgi:4-alpha-glucanotransferase
MGLRRLWLVPEGASPADGAYLDYPLVDFLRLVAIESHAHGGVVVAEDLGTVPPGFREALSARGVLGMRVLPFEREAPRETPGDAQKDVQGDPSENAPAGFLPPAAWQPDAVAMTSTHDLAPIAGWWVGRDLAWRARLRGDVQPTAQAIAERRAECTCFWNAAVDAGVASGPAPDADSPEHAVDAAIAYVAASPCALAIVPVEDLLGLCESPNLPGTVETHPNWRRRLDAPIADALAVPIVAARVATLRRRGRR